jgi:hypothetical protein
MPPETASIRAGSYSYLRKIDCLNLYPGAQKAAGAATDQTAATPDGISVLIVPKSDRRGRPAPPL